MKKLFVSVVVVGIGAFSRGAVAGSAAGTLTVGAQVSGACTVNASSIDFGTFDSRSVGVDSDKTGTVSVTCSMGTAYVVKLDAGANPGTTLIVTTRRMSRAGTDFLSYSLFTSCLLYTSPSPRD